jgi:predicted TIM-barrel fold metal-dependent hydrolase
MAAPIDAHVHVWTADRKRYPRAQGERDYLPSHFTPEHLFRHSIPSGVSRVVLIQMSFYGFDNSYMLDCIRHHPGVFSGVGIIDVYSPEPDKQMMRLAQQGVRGFRIVPGRSASQWLDGDGMHTMWKTGAQQRLAICPLIGPDALPAIDRMCAQHPDTPVVIDHLARIGVDGIIRDRDVRALCSLAKHRSVKVKVSALYALGRKQAPYTDLLPLIRSVFDAYGSNRLMWASDCPFQVSDGHTYESSIALVRDALPFLTPEDRDWILSRTAASAFFLNV